MPNEVKWAISLVAGVGLVALGWKVPFVLYALHILLCFLLIIVVLMQSGKAADLAGAFGGSGSQTAFGPRGATTILSKITTWCFVMFLMTTVSLTLRQSRIGPTGSSILEKTNPSAPVQQIPTPAPQPQPQQQQPAPQPPAQQQPATQTPAQQPAGKQPTPPPPSKPK